MRRKSTGSRPRHEVRDRGDAPTLVLVTVCTKDRTPWLTKPQIPELIVNTWRQATHWRVGRFVILPEHVHLFVVPELRDASLESWVRYWKSKVRRSPRCREYRWQMGYWDRQLRSSDNYDQKWEYVRHNPVRHGYVRDAKDWPYQGEVFPLAW